MKKIFYIAIPLIFIVVLAIIFFVFRKGQPAGQPGTENDASSPASLPASSSSSSTSAPASTPGDEIAIDPVTKMKREDNGKLLYETSSGQISLNNFVKNAEITNYGIIYPIDNEKYNVGYNSTSNEFIVTLLVTNNIENIRRTAEDDLLVKLGVSKEDACKLNIYLYVSAALTDDKTLSQNHGLSFCPDSTAFPN